MIEYLKNIEKKRKGRKLILRKYFEKEIKKALDLILKKKINFKRIYLYGSLTEKRKNLKPWSDIDLVIEGLEDKIYFKIYAELLKNIEVPVDLKLFEDLDELSKKRIRAKGIILYEKR